jgi:membrane fusion protein, multidrug efflux system
MDDGLRKGRAKKRKAMVINLVFSFFILAAIFWGIYTFLGLNRDLYTNDAQVEEYISPVSTRVAGFVKEVRYQDHQPVKKGDTLLIIDDREFKIQLEQAEAEYLAAQVSKNVTLSSATTARSNLLVNDANKKALEARVWNARQNYTRFENLVRDSAATQQQFEQAKTEYEALAAQTSAIGGQSTTTRLSAQEILTRVGIHEAEIKRTHARVEQARLNIAYTIITAPYNGVAGRRNVQEGQLLQAGQTVLSLIKNDKKWVVANYKETDVTRLHVGQAMRVKMDGIADELFRGRVIAISQATGNRFATIPLDNSTGNFVKVRQRVPVRIELLPDSTNKHSFERLIAGMNATVTIDKE